MLKEVVVAWKLEQHGSTQLSQYVRGTQANKERTGKFQARMYGK